MVTRIPFVRDNNLYYEHNDVLICCSLESDEGLAWLKQGMRFTVENADELYTAYAEHKGEKMYWRLQKKTIAGSIHVAIDPPFPNRFSLADAIERLQKKTEQVLPSDASPSWLPHASTFPHPLGPIYGRTQELEVLTHALGTSSHRLMTLTGFGGVGKTALALALIEHVYSESFSRVVWISYEQEPKEHGFLPAIQRTLALSNTDEPLPLTLKKVLSKEDLLLVLDGCEHLLPQKDELLNLLMLCPKLRVLATSCIPFAVQGEWVYQVTPLDVSELAEAQGPDELLAHPSMKLLLQHVPGILKNEEYLSDLQKVCYILGGIPLALILATVQLRVLTPKELLTRYHGRWLNLSSSTPVSTLHHASLRETIESSLSLLSFEARRLFRWLAPFRGRTALEQITQLTQRLKGPNPLPLLEELCLSSLLERTASPEGESFFRLHEPVRELAQEELQTYTTEAAGVYVFHAQIYVELAETLEPDLVAANWPGGTTVCPPAL